jgi:hypothetical protein
MKTTEFSFFFKLVEKPIDLFDQPSKNISADMGIGVLSAGI